MTCFKLRALNTYLYAGRTFLCCSLQNTETAICHSQEEKAGILVPVLPSLGNTTLPFWESVWALTPGGSAWVSEISVSAHGTCLMTLGFLLAHWALWKQCQHAPHNMLLTCPYKFTMKWDNRIQHLTLVHFLIVKYINGTAPPPSTNLFYLLLTAVAGSSLDKPGYFIKLLVFVSLQIFKCC